MKKLRKYLFTILCLLFLTTGVNAQDLKIEKNGYDKLGEVTAGTTKEKLTFWNKLYWIKEKKI